MSGQSFSVFPGRLRVLALGACLAALGGCGVVPQKPLVQQPMTARPPPRSLPSQTNGSIYNPGYSDHPLFEDPRRKYFRDQNLGNGHGAQRHGEFYADHDSRLAEGLVRQRHHEYVRRQHLHGVRWRQCIEYFHGYADRDSD